MMTAMPAYCVVAHRTPPPRKHMPSKGPMTGVGGSMFCGSYCILLVQKDEKLVIFFINKVYLHIVYRLDRFLR